MTGAEAAVAAAGVVVLVVLAWTLRSRRSLARRLGTLAQRLEAELSPAAATRGFERNASRLERAVYDAVARVDEAEVVGQRLAAAYPPPLVVQLHMEAFFQGEQAVAQPLLGDVQHRRGVA